MTPTPAFDERFVDPDPLAQFSKWYAQAQATGMRRARAVKDARDRESAEQVARVLVTRVIRIAGRAGPEGRLFGSVTTADLVAAVQEQAGVTLERKRVHLDEPIKSVGTHEVPVRLHPEVEFRLPVEVVATK